jgi:hypothetical protein
VALKQCRPASQSELVHRTGKAVGVPVAWEDWRAM